MDILKDKQTKTFDYNSRYAGVPYYFNTADNKYICGLAKQMRTDSVYVLYKVNEPDTLDFLADKYYGRPDLFWVIAEFNGINDPFIKLSDYYTELKLPSINLVSYDNF